MQQAIGLAVPTDARMVGQLLLQTHKTFNANAPVDMFYAPQTHLKCHWSIFLK
jgi:hypothetical protein